MEGCNCYGLAYNTTYVDPLAVHVDISETRRKVYPMTSTFWRGDLHSGVDRTIKLSRSDRPLTDPKTVHRTVLCTLTMTAGAPRLDITATNVDSPSQIEG